VKYRQCHQLHITSRCRRLNPRFWRVRKITESNYQLRHVCLSFRPSFRMERFGSYPTDFHEIWYWIIFRKFVEKIQVSLKSSSNNGYVHFWFCLWQLVLKWEMFRIKVVEKIKTHFMFNNFIENRVVYEIKLKNIVQ
jgi:hypothetical protein